MSPEAILKVPNGFLRPMRESDVTKDYVSGLNDPRVNQYLEVRHHLQTYDSVSSFVKMNKDSSDMILWGFWYGEELQERLVGTLRLHGINNAEQNCHIGICLFERAVWGKGLGSHVIKKATEWAFKNLDLKTVRAGIYIENIASQRAFRRADYSISHGYEIPRANYKCPDTCNLYLARRKDYMLEGIDR